MATEPELSASDWAVLGLLGEGPTHGFALASSLGPGGGLGRVWTLRRPIVYQALARLQDAGLVVPVATEPSRAGPSRTILSLTPAGRFTLERWLDEPVEHVRDVRSLLLLKLALLVRARRSVAPLASRQRELLRPALVSLEREAEAAEGFERIVAGWRVASYRATAEFLDGLLAEDRPPPGPVTPAPGTPGRTDRRSSPAGRPAPR